MTTNPTAERRFTPTLRPTQPAPVFVYGSLRPGMGNARMWEGRGYRHLDATLSGLGLRYTHRSFPYGFLIDDEVTVGELILDVDADLLERLDWLEGHPSHYRRVPVLVDIDAGQVEAWVYVGARREMDGMRPVPGNDWREFADTERREDDLW